MKSDEKPERADRFLVTHGFFETRARAQAAIEAGQVVADGKPVIKPSQPIPPGAKIEAAPAHPYVSRGALKLEAALDHFRIDPKGKTCLDVGASTGGFTELLLKRGASKVYAVDVGTGQLHASLKSDPRVISLEQTDMRTLPRTAIPEAADLIVVDVSFISLQQVLPAALGFAARHAELVALVKPQFEAGREHVKKGIVRDAGVHDAVCQRVELLVGMQGWRLRGTIPSPISGGDGNAEFLLYAEH